MTRKSQSCGFYCQAFIVRQSSAAVVKNVSLTTFGEHLAYCLNDACAAKLKRTAGVFTRATLRITRCLRQRCVRPSVCPSHAGIVPIYIAERKQDGEMYTI